MVTTGLHARELVERVTADFDGLVSSSVVCGGQTLSAIDGIPGGEPR